MVVDCGSSMAACSSRGLNWEARVMSRSSAFLAGGGGVGRGRKSGRRDESVREARFTEGREHVGGGGRCADEGGQRVHACRRTGWIQRRRVPGVWMATLAERGWRSDGLA